LKAPEDFKTDTNPSGETVTFHERDHTYVTSGGIMLTSVTTFISSYFPKFDSQRISAIYAKKHDMTQKDVLKMWHEKGYHASRLGTAVHNYCEGIMTGTDIPYEKEHKDKERFEALLKTSDTACAALKEKFELVTAEKIVFSVDLGLAGQVDLIMRNPKNGNILVLDWKTNEKIEDSNFWRNASSPLCHLSDCNKAKYDLQLSVYKHLLVQEGYFPDANNYSMMLIHLKQNNIDWLKVENVYGEDVMAMLEFL